MATITLAEHTSATDAPSAVVLEGCHEVQTETFVAVLGHDDFAEPAAGLRADLADQRHEDKTLLVALAGGVAERPADVLGYAWLVLHREDNRHLAGLDVLVRPSARRAGIGTALWRAAEARARAAGRTTVTSWSVHGPEPADGPGVLAAPTGAGRVRADDPATRFALAHGFTLEQTERHSTLALPVPPERLAAWRAEAAAVAGPDYRLVSWTGPTPEERLAGMAALRSRMSTDVPSAGLEFEEEAWDAERMRHADEQLVARGGSQMVTAVEHVPSGELVAFTALDRREHDVVFQEDTLVRADHRGHRLGLLVKAVNLQLLARTFPGARRVHTWNAGENRFMLDINERMGFVPASVEGAWQLRLA